MQVITDQVDILLSWVKEGLLNVPDFHVYVLEDEWNALSKVSQNRLTPFKLSGVIRFIDSSSIAHSHVFHLYQKFKHGVSLRNCILLQHCLNTGLSIITNDPTIVLKAAEQNIDVRNPGAFKVDLLLESLFDMNQPPRKMEKILLKRTRNKYPPS